MRASFFVVSSALVYGVAGSAYHSSMPRGASTASGICPFSHSAGSLTSSRRPTCPCSSSSLAWETVFSGTFLRVSATRWLAFFAETRKTVSETTVSQGKEELDRGQVGLLLDVR